MKPIRVCMIGGLISLLIPFSLAALTILECVDSDGSTSFRDICPPGMTIKNRKVVGRKSPEPGPEDTRSIDEIASANPVRLFVAPNCEACDLVRKLLAARNVPFAEKDASQDAEVQAELAGVTDGPLTVPTVTIGDLKFTGYNKIELDAALNGAGFPPPQEKK